MSASLQTVDVGGAAPYRIAIGPGLLKGGDLLAHVLRGRHALIVSDANVAPLYLHRVDAWVFMILFGVVSIYDAGNFLVGTGSRRAWVGPLAGLLGAAAVVFGAAGFEAPPLTEQTTWLVGGLAALACPFGQIIGSFMLPRPDARAPALRRLDSYLLAAPLTLAVFLLLGGNRPLL